MATRTAYFYHSPRGFANEASVYAVPAEQADDWQGAFEVHLGSSALYAATAVVRVTRTQAERMIRRDGVGLAIRPDDWDFDCTEKRITPRSLRSARRNALDLLDDWRNELKFAADFAEAYA